jgi:glycosyltransferase involved in cell wall biosynthesis
MSRLAVAYVCSDPGVPVFGCKGASVHVQEILRAFSRRGAAVRLYARRLGGEPSRDLEAVAVHALAAVPSLASPELFRQGVFAANRSLRAALEGDPEISLVYERHSLFSFAALEVARARGIPGILEVNAPLVDEALRFRGLTHPELARDLCARAYRAAGTIVAVSRGVAAALEREPASHGKVVVVGNGVDVARFAAPREPTARRTFTIGFVGGLKPWHGLETLIEAFARFAQRRPYARLAIVGDGPGRDAIRAEIEARGLGDRVLVPGAVAPSEIPGWLARFDVAVAPYSALDGVYGSPLKLLEYMASGVAIAASRIGQCAELIEDGRSGLLCEPGDASALTRAFERLEQSPSLRLALGRAACEAARARHGWDAVLDAILAASREPRSELPSLRRMLVAATSTI